MTAKEELHRLVDQLPEMETIELVDRLRRRGYRPKSVEEFNRSLDDLAGIINPNAPPIPLEKLSRDELYD